MDRYGSAIIVGFTYMYICHDCGCLVANKDQHNGWHDQLYVTEPYLHGGEDI